MNNHCALILIILNSNTLDNKRKNQHRELVICYRITESIIVPQSTENSINKLLNTTYYG